MNKPSDHIFIIFGASGDLTKRKLIPAIYSLFVQNLLPENFALLGVSRTHLDDEAFRNNMKLALQEFREIEDHTKEAEFLDKVYYQAINTEDVNDYRFLKKKIHDLRVKHEISGNAIYYLSTPPNLYGVIPKNLAAHKMNDESGG